MLHKKGPLDDMANYRAICLLCYSYKLLSAVVARRLMTVLEDRLPDAQAGFRPARGCRDNNNNNNTFIYIAPYPAGCSWRLTTQYIIVINIKVNYF